MLNVPGIGSVPVFWLPASDEDHKDASEGGRSGFQPEAIVHHRAVTDLAGLDATFAASDADPATVGSPGRSVSANFGIGHRKGTGTLAIHQYVNLSDTAYCNGDCRANTHPAEPSRWDKWYGHKGHNERTVSIEHEDNGQFAAGTEGRGVVTEDIIAASIALDALLLTGDIAAIRAAGIKIRDQATATALGKIVPGPTTLIDHNDIAGANKPYCWRPWAKDAIGFPRARYVAALTPQTYTKEQLDAAVKAATLAQAQALLEAQADLAQCQRGNTELALAFDALRAKVAAAKAAATVIAAEAEGIRLL